MHPAYQLTSPSSLGLAPSRQSKVAMQKQYREKEGEYFSTLRDIIKDLTGEELQTRKEILRKAINLLKAASEIRQQREIQNVPPAPCEIDGSVPWGNFVQSSSWPQNWQVSADSGLDAPSVYYYTTPSHDHW